MKSSERTTPGARRSAWAFLVSAVLGGAGAAGVCGCAADEDCHRSFTCEFPRGTRCQEDVTLWDQQNDEWGVFVSASLGDDANPGTPDRPVKTIGRALVAQIPYTNRIYACAETFDLEATLSIPTEVEIWGGFDCHDGWRDVHRDHAKRTVLRTRQGAATSLSAIGNPTAVGLEVAARVTLADLDIDTQAVVAPGGSVVALLAARNAEVDLCRSALVAGDGLDGMDGDHAWDAAAAEGAPGNDGSRACLKDTSTGGVAALTACYDGESIGGAGGTGDDTGGGPGYEGVPAPESNPFGYGLGGGGERTMPACLNGNDGLPGQDGANGLGARGPGTFTPTGWFGGAGYPGVSGARGQGAGGGGGSRGGVPYCATSPNGGASGGSGGAGGCGGRRGGGGEPGGASVGLLVYGGTVRVLEGVSITTGRGGAGGHGGRGQLGGMGGAAGIGGTSVNGSRPGCAGGWGGKGGNAGHGGGGLGGPSIGIASLGLSVDTPYGVSFDIGAAGQGGPGGGDDADAGRGQAGERGDAVQFAD